MISKSEAEDKRDQGIALVAENADVKNEGWSIRALDYFEQFCVEAPETFMVEDARDWCYGQGLDKPHDDRAWGAIVRRASGKGIIRRAGYAAARSSNLSPKVLWTRKEAA